MDKIPPPEESASFVRNDSRKNNAVPNPPGSPAGFANGDASPPVEHVKRAEEEQDDVGHEKVDEEQPQSIEEPDMTLPQIFEEVDRFIGGHASEDEWSSTEMPKAIELLSKRVESEIRKFDSGSRLGSGPDADSSLFESINGLSRLTNKLETISSENNSVKTQVLSRTSMVLQRAMSSLEDELRRILDKQLKPNEENETKSIKTRHSSSFNSSQESDRCVLNEQNPSAEDELLPVFSHGTISLMNLICTSMIQSGYETECCMVYSISRGNAFKSALTKLGLDAISMDDVQKMPWESLEGEIATWISTVKQCSTDLFPTERNLCKSVFSSSPQICRSMFGNLVRSVIIQLLNFAEAVVLTKRSAERLFKFLDMYETLRDLNTSFDESYDDDAEEEVRAEITAAKTRIGEAAVRLFCDLENSIRSDNGKTPVPSGVVHPLTRYTMNYLEYACEYKETLEQVFQQHQNLSRNGDGESDSTNNNHRSEETEVQAANSDRESSPFSVQLMSVMDLLDANLDMNSKLYRDTSLRYIFLMNNGRYILQKIKGSPEIHELMGGTWCRKRSSDLRQYHKIYQRETWYRLLQCLSHEGLMMNGKVLKPALKEKFKSFNTMFDEIHKTQSTWVVNDEQMQSELRVSVAAVVTPAYRSFLGRFSQYLDGGRQSEKYIKYQPEDIEGLIDELFDGNAASMGRRKT